MCNCNNHIGFTPGSERKVTPVPSHLLGLVPLPTDTVVTVKPSTPDVERDTMPLIVEKSKRTAWQVKKLAKTLKGKTLTETLRNNSNFILKHIKYEKDHPQHEQIRSPRRTIHEGKGDCDCFSVLLAALLINQGIKFKFRIAKYPHSPSNYSHIYLVVPKNQSTQSTNAGEYYTLDPVTNRHDFEVKFLRKKDYDMALQSLDGFGECKPKHELLDRKKPGDFIPVKTLLNRGHVITSKLLHDARIPFQSDEHGNLIVKTAAGVSKLPAMLSPDQLQQFKKQVGTPQPVRAVAGLGATPKNSLWWLLPVLAVGAFALTASGSKEPSVLEGHKRSRKHVPVIQL